MHDLTQGKERREECQHCLAGDREDIADDTVDIFQSGKVLHINNQIRKAVHEQTGQTGHQIVDTGGGQIQRIGRGGIHNSLCHAEGQQCQTGQNRAEGEPCDPFLDLLKAVCQKDTAHIDQNLHDAAYRRKTGNLGIGKT